FCRTWACAPAAKGPRDIFVARRAGQPRQLCEVLLAQREDLALAVAGLEPQEGQGRHLLFQRGPAAADLHQQDAIRGQMLAGSRKNAPYEGEAIATACMRQSRLGSIFGREGGNGSLGNVGWIGQDKVVALAGMRSEQVGLLQANAVLEGVFAHV